MKVRFFIRFDYDVDNWHCWRKDGENYIELFKNESKNAYVETKEELQGVDFANTERLLGLFHETHMSYADDRDTNHTNLEPSLKDMTAAAITMLSKNDRGFFLMVEGSGIDQAHHGARVIFILCVVSSCVHYSGQNEMFILKTHVAAVCSCPVHL